MIKLKSKTWWIAAGTRAIKTTCQTLASMLPVGFVITPAMIESANWTMLYVALAWLGTGLLAGFGSLLTSLAGLPECKEAEYGKN